MHQPPPCGHHRSRHCMRSPGKVLQKRVLEGPTRLHHRCSITLLVLQQRLLALQVSLLCLIERMHTANADSRWASIGAVLHTCAVLSKYMYDD